MVINNIKPIIDVTLEKGKSSRFTKWFRYWTISPDKETRCHVQLEIKSGVLKYFDKYDQFDLKNISDLSSSYTS